MANTSDTTFVVDFTSVRAEPEKILFFGNHKMSGTNKPAQTYMRLMAHVPLLAQKDPRKALLICFGVGNTASAIASHQSIETIDIVDRNSNVFLTARVFNRWNKNVIDDPRLRLINDDGRAYLRKTDEKYDLITSEPPPPMASGVYRLYSLDYYLDAIEHLTPSGMMSQWLPIYQLPQEAADLIIRTFVTAFPHTILIIGYQFSNGSELILVGSRLPIDMETVISRMREDESVEADLAEIDIERDNDLRFRLVADDEELRRVYGSGRVLRDQYNDLEHLILNPNNTARYAGASRKNKRRFRRNQKEAVQ
jgi:spermidine synthase